MAIATLKGTTDGTADLSNATHFEEGVALADNGTLVLPPYPLRITGGLDRSSFGTGINIVCQAGCAVETVGTLLVKVLSMVVRGSAKLSISGAVTKHSIEGGEVTAVGGTWAAGVISGGLMRYTDGSSITDIDQYGGGCVIDGHGSDTVNNLRIGGGSLSSKRTILAADLAGNCLVTMLKAASIGRNAGSGIVRLMSPGARLLLQNESAITIDYLKCYAGTVDPEGSGAPPTFTDAIRTGLSNIRNIISTGAVVYTNTPTDNGYLAIFDGGAS